jgi:prefoldin subunit 5
LPVSTASSLERLTNEQRILDQQIQRLLKEIEAIESRPPLTMRSDLVDDDWVRNRCETIQTTMTELQQRCAGLASHIENLLKEYPGEQSFGKN